ncbi:MAG: response regulator transcription factor [Lachnospiraceae bacterium]|nr:response regulator transcription factor [Lachnospiraceae bacterium]
MRIYVCDDEPQILKGIVEKVRACMPQGSVEEQGNATELLARLKEQDCDILLLDIDMPGISGLEAAKQMKDMGRKPLLIFVTGHDELVYDSLLFHPFGFVRKSFLDAELPKVLADCEKELLSKRQHVHLRTTEGEVNVSLEDILYFETQGNYLQVYAGTKSYRIRETISALQEELEAQGFVRVHRGFLVNQAAVELLGTDELKLTDGRSIPIGRNYAEAAKKQIMRYMLR